MIAKFHSAPGHSMETTLTINIPPVNSVRGVRSEREREKERRRDLEWERQKEVREKEREKERKLKEEETEKGWEKDKEKERERLMLEQDRAKVQTERNVSYKEKFQKMRDKYDKVTAVHESQQKDLEILNAKLKKLQYENDLLLDALYVADAPLYERYFPSQRGSPSPPHNPSMALPASNSLQPNSQLPPPRFSDVLGPTQLVPSSHYTTSMAPPRSMAPPPISVASSSSSGRPGSVVHPPMQHPLPTMPSSSALSASMPPPLSVSSNGIAVGNGISVGREPSSRPSPASSTRTSRRRNDIIVSPEDIVVNASESNTSTQISVPIEMATEEDMPYRNLILNGIARSIPRPDTPISNGIGAASAARYSPEHSPDVHDSENEADHRRDLIIDDAMGVTIAHSDSEVDAVPPTAEEGEMDIAEDP